MRQEHSSASGRGAQLGVSVRSTLHRKAVDSTPSPPPTPPPNPATPTEPAQNAAGVWHYTCAKGCAGGAGIATACSSCGGMLAHNAAYHN